MTPKFDNLTSMLMEMPVGVPITDEEKLEIATYIEQFPEATYQEIAAAFGVSHQFVGKIAMELDIQRSQGRKTKLTGDQEIQMLDYWMANHDETTFKELVRWIKQQFNVILTNLGFSRLLNRVAAKHGVELPPPDSGKGPRLRKQRSQHRNEPGSGKLPTQGSHHFKGSTDIVPSNPKHGGPAHPPK